MKKEIKYIDQQTAKDMLDFHRNTKPIDPSIYKRMEKDLEAGIFDKENANVVLYYDGGIYYGQYILNAIAECGIGHELNIFTLDKGEEATHKAGSLNHNTIYKWKGFVPGADRENIIELIRKYNKKSEN